MIFHDKTYHRLNGLQDRWKISEDDVRCAVESSLLRICIFLPLRYVECGLMQDDTFILEHYDDKSGLVAVRPEDYNWVCRKGEAKLRIFHCTNIAGRIFRLAMEPAQIPVIVYPHDFLVLRDDCRKFEKTLRPKDEA